MQWDCLIIWRSHLHGWAMPRECWINWHLLNVEEFLPISLATEGCWRVGVRVEPTQQPRGSHQSLAPLPRRLYWLGRPCSWVWIWPGSQRREEQVILWGTEEIPRTSCLSYSGPGQDAGFLKAQGPSADVLCCRSLLHTLIAISWDRRALSHRISCQESLRSSPGGARVGDMPVAAWAAEVHLLGHQPSGPTVLPVLSFTHCPSFSSSLLPLLTQAAQLACLPNAWQVIFLLTFSIVTSFLK